ncbi:MAG: PEGA domain-containing protein [Lentisphaerota bacterium]|jgi:hypothetical protein
MRLKNQTSAAESALTRRLTLNERVYRTFLGLAVLCVMTTLLACAGKRAESVATPAAELQIVSVPAGARVLINRVERGTTPLTVSNLPPGEHLVTLITRGYRDHYETAVLGVNARRMLDVTLEPLSAMLIAQSTPRGATVSAGGVDLGVTPILINSLLPGTHRLRFNLPGFQPTEREVILSERTPVKVAVDLRSDSATLTLVTDPPGATVTVNGIPRGTTPCVVERIPEGEAIIDVRSDGFIGVSQPVKLAAGEAQTLNLTLSPKPARLVVTSRPSGARVYINNERRGDTPLTLAELQPGTYRVRVEKDGYDPLARTLDLVRAGDSIEEFGLASNTGLIQLTTTPADVEIFVAGKTVGKTVASKEETTNLSNPLLIGGLAVGTHALKLVRKGWAEKTIEVAVQRGETVTRHVALDRLFIPDYEVITVSGTVYRGVFYAITDLGVRMETAPGVITDIAAKDIQKRGSLRDDMPK